MKKYMKPQMEVISVKAEPLMEGSIVSLEGDAIDPNLLDDVTVSVDDFLGGEADARDIKLWED